MWEKKRKVLPGRPWSRPLWRLRAPRSRGISPCAWNSLSVSSSTIIWPGVCSLAGDSSRPRSTGSIPPDTSEEREISTKKPWVKYVSLELFFLFFWCYSFLLPSCTILHEANSESCRGRGGCRELVVYPGPSLVTTGCTVTWAKRNAAAANTLAMLGSTLGS